MNSRVDRRIPSGPRYSACSAIIVITSTNAISERIPDTADLMSHAPARELRAHTLLHVLISPWQSLGWIEAVYDGLDYLVVGSP